VKPPKYKPRINYKVDITIEDLNIVNYTEMGYAAEVVLNGDDRITVNIL